MGLRGFWFAPLLVLAACQTPVPLPGSVVENIHGRKVESILVENPHARAVVVFENGARGTIDKWEKVLAEVKKDATVFAYNRPGYANSEATDSTRDGKTIVEELRQVLQHKGLKPPYILVGHSLGGLYMQLFAKTYPNEVQGIVLVDALYPGVIKRPEDFPFTTRVAKRLFFSPTVQHEVDHIHDTGEAIWALPGIDDKPMIRLFNVPKSATAIGVDFGVLTNDPKVIAQVRQLYPKARKVIADSDHEMQTDNPALVVTAIRDVLDWSVAPPPK
jgi:pimeloyl-ACP methyl ester carboxylesterase